MARRTENYFLDNPSRFTRPMQMVRSKYAEEEVISMGRMNSTSTAMRRSSSAMSSADMNDLIRKKAYELYEKRGRKGGNALSDWLEAERIVRASSR